MQHWSARRAILTGGLVAGLLDIAFAISFAYIEGMPPLRLLQLVASGLAGEAAYAGGVAASALGLGLHFLICLLLAGCYYLASLRIPFLTRNALLAGALFGIGVFFLMRLVVLPLSAFPHPVSFRPLASALDLLSHMFLFGVPIALAVRRTRSS